MSVLTKTTPSLLLTAARLGTTSCGKEQPLCSEAVESCRVRNRRAHVSLK